MQVGAGSIHLHLLMETRAPKKAYLWEACIQIVLLRCQIDWRPARRPCAHGTRWLGAAGRLSLGQTTQSAQRLVRGALGALTLTAVSRGRHSRDSPETVVDSWLHLKASGGSWSTESRRDVTLDRGCRRHTPSNGPTQASHLFRKAGRLAPKRSWRPYAMPRPFFRLSRWTF